MIQSAEIMTLNGGTRGDVQSIARAIQTRTPRGKDGHRPLTLKTRGQFFNVANALAQASDHRKFEVSRELVKVARAIGRARDRGTKVRLERRQLIKEGGTIGCQPHRGLGGRGAAEIRDQFGDGRVRLVPDRGNDRDR